MRDKSLYREFVNSRERHVNTCALKIGNSCFARRSRSRRFFVVNVVASLAGRCFAEVCGGNSTSTQSR